MNAPLRGQGWSPGRVPGRGKLEVWDFFPIQWVRVGQRSGRGLMAGQETTDCSSASSAEAGISIHAAVSVQRSAQRTGRPG